MNVEALRTSMGGPSQRMMTYSTTGLNACLPADFEDTRCEIGLELGVIGEKSDMLDESDSYNLMGGWAVGQVATFDENLLVVGIVFEFG